MFTKCVIVAFFVAYCLALPSAEDKKVHNGDTVSLDLRAYFLQTGYIVIEDTQNRTNYLISTTKKVDYFMALSFCKNLDMRLLEIDSPDKTDVIKSLIKDYPVVVPFWMGASRLADGRTWTWANNTPVTYFNWAFGEPSNAKGDEMCMEVFDDAGAKWDDQRCTEEIGFICETQDNSFIANFKGLM